MVSVAPIISQPVPQPVGEKRFLFHELDWQRYQLLRDTLSRDRNIRFTYMHGTLEVAIPLEIHEFSARLIELFIRILVVELGMKVKLYEFLSTARQDEVDAELALREWVRSVM
ncbi:hypothetical protein Lepto7375DRAFT_1315 [Leptolyngbya sp. PCC 7375]|nr:hypothetical protein Lepto7375DRAFT_1315 [Leptolyngbya sp. PCC 7375]